MSEHLHKYLQLCIETHAQKFKLCRSVYCSFADYFHGSEYGFCPRKMFERSKIFLNSNLFAI